MPRYRIRVLLTIIVFLSANFLTMSGQGMSVPFSDYLTPQMFGAKGDGRTDDTEALRKALYESSERGQVLYIPSGFIYKVTGSLNYYQGSYRPLRLNLMGCIPIKRGEYVAKEYGGFIVTNGVKVFKSAIISGSIERVSFTGQRDENVHFFSECDCKSLVITGCNISNFGALFYDSRLHSVSQITHNTFLTLFYFARNVKTSSGMTDSTISFNYINGGMELNDNSCFEWSYYNGDIISNNFIDYYRTIYYPRAISKQAFVGPLSYSNQYQVFRYFFAADPNIDTVTFSSSSDSFNWNDPSTLEKLQKYKELSYRGKDGKEYVIPPYVARCEASWIITISDAKVERNMGTLVFVGSSLTEFEYNRFEVSFVGNNPYKSGQIAYKMGDPRPFYNNGKFCENSMKISGIVEILESLPSSSIGWSSSVQGRVVKVGQKLYKACNRRVGKSWKAEWIEVTNY